MYTWDILHDRVEKDGISLSMWRSSGFVSFWASSTGSTKRIVLPCGRISLTVDQIFLYEFVLRSIVRFVPVRSAVKRWLKSGMEEKISLRGIRVQMGMLRYLQLQRVKRTEKGVYSAYI